MFPWKKWVLMIYEVNHIWTAEMKWKWRNDRRFFTQLHKLRSLRPSFLHFHQIIIYVRPKGNSLKPMHYPDFFKLGTINSHEFVCNTGAAFNLYQLSRDPTCLYACSLCIDAPIPGKKKKRTGRESPSPIFSEGRKHLYTGYISTCWWCFWIAFFSRNDLNDFLVPLIKNGRTLWKSASIFLGNLIQSFVTNIKLKSVQGFAWYSNKFVMKMFWRQFQNRCSSPNV